MAEVRARFLVPFADLRDQLEAARSAASYPFFDCVDATAATPGKTPVVLVANDYLGLSADSRVREAACAAVAQLGTSRCASPLAGGYTTAHHALEKHLADFLEQDGAVLFASGYQANVGVISALVGRGDLIVSDMFDHASIVDGARMSGADMRFFRHNTPAHLDAVLRREAAGRRALVIVEGIYSADGDIARLPELCRIAHAHGALLLIDEAHSFGVLGERGAGAAEHFGLLRDVDVIVGTMSKSLASVGGFAAADDSIMDVIRHGARALIFSAAVTPPNVAAADAALAVLASEPAVRKRLWHNARRMLRGLERLGFDTLGSSTPVIPVLVGDPARTLFFTARLRELGVLVCPAVPPMVQGHLSRLRLHVTANHDDASIDRALEHIAAVGRELGVIPPPGDKRGRRARVRLRSVTGREA